MRVMDTSLSWTEAALRLGLTFFGAVIIGWDREEHGRPAGLRTTVLVCLTASSAMILGSLLLPTTGRPWDSYVTMDVMRLPLGILTGVGFIGAGAILHKGNFVLGVTTAASLWFSTVVGLCFGAGMFGLGGALVGLGLIVLWGMRWMEKHLMHRTEATVTFLLAREGPTQLDVMRALESAGYNFSILSAAYDSQGREFRFDVFKKVSHDEVFPPRSLALFAESPGVRELRWSRHP